MVLTYLLKAKVRKKNDGFNAFEKKEVPLKQ